MRVVLQKVDMDTCLAGLILGVNATAEVVIRSEGATLEELLDPTVLCIEAGGSGDVARNNFDHHGPGAPDEPACVQAAHAVGLTDPRWTRLINYVAAVDTGSGSGVGRHAFPTLSNLFSGMMLAEGDGPSKFATGIALFRHVIANSIDPFGTMPDRPEWSRYIEAKRRSQAGLAKEVESAELFQTVSGALAGFVASEHPGALGALYELGCRYGIALAEHFVNDEGLTVRKCTIGSRRGFRLDNLLPALDELERGWGGPSHGSIIGSPRQGSSLPVETLRHMVCRYC